MDFNLIRILKQNKEMAQGRGTEGVRVDKLTKEFLAMSKFNTNKTLNVSIPSLYELKGSEIGHYREALGCLGIEARVPEKIGIGGLFDENEEMQDLVIIVSEAQVEGAAINKSRGQLAPLFRKCFIDGKPIVESFALNEALLGRIKITRGEIELKEAGIFPKKFTRGPYTLSVTLDTPNGTVKELTGLKDIILEIKEDPEKGMLDRTKVNEVTDLSINLRKRIGAPERYLIPENRTFEAVVNTTVLRNGENLNFFLYNPISQQNVLVYFGKPVIEHESPKDLVMLDGEDSEETLSTLIKLDFYKPSPAVLETRIRDINQIGENTARGTMRAVDSESYEEFMKLKGILEDSKTQLEIGDERARKEYALKMSKQALEFVLEPNPVILGERKVDPVLVELLSMLSWNDAIREYQHTARFAKRFINGDERTREEMVDGIASNLMLMPYQNNDTNLWLYKNHRALLESKGIKFNAR